MRMFGSDQTTGRDHGTRRLRRPGRSPPRFALANRNLTPRLPLWKGKPWGPHVVPGPFEARRPQPHNLEMAVSWKRGDRRPRHCRHLGRSDPEHRSASVRGGGRTVLHGRNRVRPAPLRGKAAPRSADSRRRTLRGSPRGGLVRAWKRACVWCSKASRRRE